MRDWYIYLIGLRKAWKQSGLLCDENLTVNTDLETGTFELHYKNERDSADVIVKLSQNHDKSSVTIQTR